MSVTGVTIVEFFEAKVRCSFYNIKPELKEKKQTIAVFMLESFISVTKTKDESQLISQ